MRRCQIYLSNKLSVLNTDSSEYENMIMKLALAEQEEKEKQKEEVSLTLDRYNSNRLFKGSKIETNSNAR